MGWEMNAQPSVSFREYLRQHRGLLLWGGLVFGSIALWAIIDKWPTWLLILLFVGVVLDAVWVFLSWLWIYKICGYNPNGRQSST